MISLCSFSFGQRLGALAANGCTASWCVYGCLHTLVLRWVLSRQEAMVKEMAAARLNGLEDPTIAFATWQWQHRLRGLMAFGAFLSCLASGTVIFSYFETNGDVVEAFYAASMSISTVG